MNASSTALADARALIAASAAEVRTLVASAIGNERALLVFDAALFVAVSVAALYSVRATLTAAADIGIGALRVVFFGLVALVLGNWALAAYVSLTGDAATPSRVARVASSALEQRAVVNDGARSVLEMARAWWAGTADGAKTD